MGTIIYCTTRTPTDQELSSLPHITLSSSATWDPHNVVFPSNCVEGGEHHTQIPSKTPPNESCAQPFCLLLGGIGQISCTSGHESGVWFTQIPWTGNSNLLKETSSPKYLPRISTSPPCTQWSPKVTLGMP